jgi:PhzF family phenazine biosynthesis protein
MTDLPRPRDQRERPPREWRMVSFPATPAAAMGGNPAGVVLDPGDPDAPEMVRTAVRLNPVSETAFVWDQEDRVEDKAEDQAEVQAEDQADGAYRVRYFAPGGEVDLCGHATAAAFAALALDHRLGPLPAEVRSVAPGGRIRGRVEAEGDDVVVWLDMPLARRVDATLDLEALAEALGLPHEVVASRPAGAIEDVGIRVALIPVADLAALDAMRPDFQRLRDLGRPHRIIVFYPFVLDADSRQVRARSFAPAVDIDEDPATGTAAASLGAYLAREGLIGPATQLRIRQGEVMGRPSEIRLHVEHRDREPSAVRVGGWVRGEPVTP